MAEGIFHLNNVFKILKKKRGKEKKESPPKKLPKTIKEKESAHLNGRLIT